MNPTRTASGTKAISRRRSVTKLGRLVTLTLILLGSVIIAGGSPASAVQQDCAFLACGFGIVAPVAGNPILTQTLSGSGNSFTASLDETVYVNGNTYTYLFTTHNAATSANPLGTLATSTLPSPIVGPAVKSFMDSSLNFGIVTTGGPAGNSTPGYTGGNTTFSFLPGSLQLTNFKKNGVSSGLVQNDTLAWYAQAKLGPAPGIVTYLDGFASTSTPPTLDPAPEPSTALLLGLGFPMLSGLLARRRRGRAKVSAATPS